MARANECVVLGVWGVAKQTMSRGVLIFAFNNTKINYFKQANWVADRVKTFLDLPTTIVTNENSLGDTKHNVVIAQAEHLSNRNFDVNKENLIDHWYNVNRYQAYSISPYDETIVIDSDYIVNSPQLNNLFNSKEDFLCHRNAYDVANKNSLAAYQTFGATHFPHYWATVLFFRKTEFAKNLFALISMIKENYSHYGRLYKFSTTPYRNDFVVSIALSIIYGHRINAIPSIPWSLPTAMTDIQVSQLDYSTFNLEYSKCSKWDRNKEKEMVTQIKDHDFHCLNKLAMEKLIDASA